MAQVKAWIRREGGIWQIARRNLKGKGPSDYRGPSMSPGFLQLLFDESAVPAARAESPGLKVGFAHHADTDPEQLIGPRKELDTLVARILARLSEGEV